MKRQKINPNKHSGNPLIIEIVGHYDSVRQVVTHLSKLYPKEKIYGESERIDGDSLFVRILMLEKPKKGGSICQ
jgi:hypothetical protein